MRWLHCKQWKDDEEWKKIIAFIRDDLLPTILYFPNFLFDFPEKIYLEDLPEESEKIRKEQAFYKEKGLDNEPKRCKECRDKRKNSRIEQQNKQN